MIQGKWFPQGADIQAPLMLRQAVFGRGRDGLDDLAQQVVVYDAGTPVGTGRLWWAEGAFHLGDVGVLASERGKGFGDLLMRLILFKAQTHHAARVELTAPAPLALFFARYGFAVTAGTALEESALANGFLHMVLNGADIALSHCGKSCEGCPASGR